MNLNAFQNTFQLPGTVGAGGPGAPVLMGAMLGGDAGVCV